MHRVYAESALTVVHLEDVTPTMMDIFLDGEDDEARLKGMIGI